MQLTPKQVADFDAQGYLFFPECFAEEEVALLRAEAENILKTERQERHTDACRTPRPDRFRRHQAIQARWLGRYRSLQTVSVPERSRSNSR